MIKKIYICHYTRLKDRKDSIDSQIGVGMLGSGSRIEFILDHDQENISEQMYNYNFDEEFKFKLTKNTFVGINSPEMTKNLNRAEISNALKHKEALLKIQKDDGNEDNYYLILEDDVLFKNPVSIIEEHLLYLSERQIECDIIFFGEGSLMRGNNQQFIYKKSHPSTNGLCTYVIRKSAALRLLQDLEKQKISFPMDHEYNYRFYKLGFHVYWATPITIHGSINGTFPSSAR